MEIFDDLGGRYPLLTTDEADLPSRSDQARQLQRSDRDIQDFVRRAEPYLFYASMICQNKLPPISKTNWSVMTVWGSYLTQLSVASRDLCICGIDRSGYMVRIGDQRLPWPKQGLKAHFRRGVPYFITVYVLQRGPQRTLPQILFVFDLILLCYHNKQSKQTELIKEVKYIKFTNNLPIWEALLGIRTLKQLPPGARPPGIYTGYMWAPTTGMRHFLSARTNRKLGSFPVLRSR